MLLVHPASAGHGLNLHDGHHLAFFSLTWNYEHYAQIIERIGPSDSIRQGTRSLLMYQIQAEGKADVQDLLMEYCKMKKPQ